ncbi:hypothetical protein ACIBJE_29535 [Micromonospora sp. NPDC050187]|uniref:hypothetical protein n=1 Tax=Micromonospora sp. NPDC050187 TaxID=3364277 RepID=UPI0037AA73C5
MVYLNNCTTVETQKEITWQFSTTIAGAEYGTATCHNGLLIIDKRITDREAFMGCETSLWFYGPLIEQMYPNCKTVGQDVAVGSTIDGQLLAPSNSRVWLNPDEAAVWLIHYHVEATFETVFVHGATLPTVSPQP